MQGLVEAKGEKESERLLSKAEESQKTRRFLFPDAGEEHLPPAPESSATDVDQSLIKKLIDPMLTHRSFVLYN